MGRSLAAYSRAVPITAGIVLDILVLTGIFTSVVMLRYVMGGGFSPDLYMSLAWTPVLYVCIAMMMGLYPGHLRTPPEEIKSVTQVLSVFFSVVAIIFFLTHKAEAYSRSIFLISWGISLIVLPLFRAGAKKLLPLWFCLRSPCVIIGESDAVCMMLRHLRRSLQSELYVVAVSTESAGICVSDFPVVSFDALDKVAAENPHCHALVLLNPCSAWIPEDAIERLSAHFQHVLLYSAQTSQISTWSRGVSLGEITFFTCQFKLLDPWRMRFKRLFDIVFCLTAGFFILPMLFVLAIIIKWDSPGPAFFRQRRLGQDGKPFYIIKFRTMFTDAKERLDRLLRENAELAGEWEKQHKLNDDPRITRAGRWLRRTSMDELPQFFNVLRGEMSLVGPRPIVDAEVPRYGQHYATCSRVKPGVTGLWQVSGRYTVPYAKRVELDVSYVRNWSIYTDIWILARTVREVFGLTGL